MATRGRKPKPTALKELEGNPGGRPLNERECSSRTVSEADLHEAVVQAVNEICAGKETVLTKLKENILAVVADNNNEQVKELNRQIAEVEEEILERTKARKDCDDLGEEIIRLREERYRLQLEDATKEDMRRKIDEMEAMLEDMGWKVSEYKEELVRKLIERITVFDDYLLVEFKSGVETEIKI